MTSSKIDERDLDQSLLNTINEKADQDDLDALQEAINAELEEVKKSASDGKAIVAAAVTNKGVSTNANATYEAIAANINGITTINDVPNRGAATIIPGVSAQTIAAGQYLTGVQTIAGDADLKSENIKAGANIFGIAGNANVVDTSSGTATAAQILSGAKAWVDGKEITGSMTNQGAKTSSLNCGGSYTIPAGYHNGSGKITANSLASQTSATASVADIMSGKTAWVNGSKLTGSAKSAESATVSGYKILSANSGSSASYTAPNPIKFFVLVWGGMVSSSQGFSFIAVPGKFYINRNYFSDGYGGTYNGMMTNPTWIYYAISTNGHTSATTGYSNISGINCSVTLSNDFKTISYTASNYTVYGLVIY